MAITTNGILALAEILDGTPSARWNYVKAVGTPFTRPGGLGTAVQVKYSFLESNPAYTGEVGFQAFGDTERDAVDEVLDLFARFTRVTFTPGDGQMSFAYSSQGDASGAYAYLPFFGTTTSGGTITEVTVSPFAGDVWLNGDLTWERGTFQPGNYGFFTLLHEVGHALGLKHPFQGANILERSLNDHSITVMAYRQAPNAWVYKPDTGFVELLYPSTPMIYDILALQYIYGANRSVRTDDTYRWARNEELLETIWDGGGQDTIDCSNQTLRCFIELRGGYFSTIGHRSSLSEMRTAMEVPRHFFLDPDDPFHPLYDGVNNLAIAFGTTIENASGGSAADTITGNAVANRLQGNRGNDTLSGLRGNDILTGGPGSDRLNGGPGSDTFDYNNVRESGVASARRDVITGFVSGTDRIDLSTIDANPARAGDQKFRFVTDFTANATGQVRFSDGMLLASTDADAAAEFGVQLSGVTTLVATDLIL